MSWDLRAVANGFQDAALDPTRWPDILAELSCVTGGNGAVMLAVNSRMPGLPTSPELKDVNADYFTNNWNLLDERYRGASYLMRNGVMSDHDYITQAEIDASPFYQEFLRKHDCIWSAGVGFASGGEFWCLSIQRGADKGPFDELEKRSLRTLLSPLHDAATLSRRLGFVKVEGLLEGLELAGQAAAVIDGEGRILHLNRAGEKEFAYLIDASNDTFRFGSMQSRTAWELYIRRVLNVDIEMDLPRAEHLFLDAFGRKLSFRAIAIRGLTDKLSSYTFLLDARVIILLSRFEGNEEAIGSAGTQYGLTASEMSLIESLIKGKTLAEAAVVLGIKYETARSRLRDVYAKTGLHRQSQLVAKFARSPS